MEVLKKKASENGVTDHEWKQMLAYSAAVFQNCGNYKSFGDTKFIPELKLDSFKQIVKSSENYEIHQDLIETILERIEEEIYNEGPGFSRIGFRDENGGTTSYYSSNVTAAEAKVIDEWCQELKISPLNTRLFKISENEFELRIAS